MKTRNYLWAVKYHTSTEYSQTMPLTVNVVAETMVDAIAAIIENKETEKDKVHVTAARDTAIIHYIA